MVGHFTKKLLSFHSEFNFTLPFFAMNRFRYCVRCLSSTSKLQSLSTRHFEQFAQKQKEIGLKNLNIPLNSETNPEGITFIMGWLGSRTKTLAKYAELHQKKNMACCCIAPSVFDAWFMNPARKKTRKLFRAAEQTFDSKTKVPIFLHVFSGASNSILYTLIPLLAQDSSPLQLKGVIFDSGPAIFGMESGMAAAKLLRQQGALTGPSYHLAVTGGVASELLCGKQRRAERTELLRNDLLSSVPQLFLLSETDVVFPPEKARELIKQQKERGVTLFNHTWRDTSHVRLFVDHPEEYKTEVVKFMTYCLNSSQ